MMIFWALVNFGIAAWMWRDSKTYFELERNAWGWFFVAGSALNFAAGLNVIWPMVS
jgi:hypothetical protein